MKYIDIVDSNRVGRSPDKIIQVEVDPVVGLQSYQCREIFFVLGLDPAQGREFNQMMLAIYKMFIECEVSLCSWKNTFICDLYGEKGSAHISSLTKWTKSSLTIRKRKLLGLADAL